MDPVISEILRIKTVESIRPDVLQRWSRYLREVIQPQLDELAELKADPPQVAKKGRAA